jgi:ribosome-associated translation inhibitor RaiA
MTREKLVQALQLAGLSEQQIEEALARLELTNRLPKVARALRKLGVQVTITVNGSNWTAEVDGLTFEGAIDEAVDQSARQVKSGKSGDSARAILTELRARGVDVSDAAIQYAATYIQRVKKLQDAIRQHPDLLDRARKLGLME